jgi:hypothetical protein
LPAAAGRVSTHFRGRYNRGAARQRTTPAGYAPTRQAKIVPPAAQNQPRIEADLRAYLPGILDRDDAEVSRRCEHMIRNYDACISCATHFLKLRIDRRREGATA